MSRKVQRFNKPMFYEEMNSDLAHWRDLGYNVVVQGEPLRLQGVDLPPLWRWFDETVQALRVARFGCAGCAKPTPVAVLELIGDEAGGERVAVVTYQQRRRTDTSREVVMARAVLHVAPPGSECRHGTMIAHVGDAPVVTFCRGCGDQPIAWQAVADTIRNGPGGWTATAADVRLAPRRLVPLR